MLYFEKFDVSKRYVDLNYAYFQINSFKLKIVLNNRMIFVSFIKRNRVNNCTKSFLKTLISQSEKK